MDEFGGETLAYVWKDHGALEEVKMSLELEWVVWVYKKEKEEALKMSC